ncbi:MAG TPA: hypothetical protein VFS67_24030 [Polyangiaceae bacterium]|nr:hypothetical protein [Polyangiaceae bacterium]
MFKRLSFGLGAGLLLGCTSGKQPCVSCKAAEIAEDMPPFAAPAPIPRASFCGDGIWDPATEECDDGSACRDGRDCTKDRLRCSPSSEAACAPRGRDGCSETCTIERGFDCPDGGNCTPTPIAEAPLFSGPGATPELSDAGRAAPPVASTPETGSGAPGGPGRCRRPRFAAPELVTGLATELELWAPSLSSDGLTLFCAANTQGTPERIFFATRLPGSSEFSALTLLANLDSGFGDGTPWLSFDGLTLYFYSRRPGGVGDRDLWFALRGDPAADFGAIHHFGAVNGAALEHLPWLSRDELSLLYVSTRPGGSGQSDVWFAQRASRGEDFRAPRLVSALSTGADEGRAVLSQDGKLVIFASAREGGRGNQDLWLATRAGGGGDDALGELEPALNLSALNSPALDVDPFLTADERELFFSSTRNGRAQIFRSRISCDD